MIIHEIRVFKDEYEPPDDYLPHYAGRRINYETPIEGPFQHALYVQTPRTITPNTTKQRYQLWLSRQYVKRGDYVVHRRNVYPYRPEAYLRVVALQEVQALLKFNDLGQPLAFEFVSSEGTRFWAAIDDYIKVSPPQSQFDLPPE